MSDLKDDTFIAVKEAVTELDWPIAIYIIEHPETPAPHKDDSTPEFIEPLL